MDAQEAYQKLYNYTSQRVAIQPADWELMKQYYHLRKVSKKDFFLKEGSTNFNQGFVVDGTLRVYYTDTKGNEHVLYFAFADWWVGDLSAFHFDDAATLNVQALEESYILEISKEDLEYLFDQIPALERLFRVMAQRTLAVLQKRFLMTVSAHAEERYQELLHRHPGIEQIVAQHQIASYLGILPESLSRMKKKLYVSSPNKK
ncbi:MAG: Crp/Fnr family transcriptional regulator [Crocinitomicaceae bacterium]|jgi:CRP-like cAMP-binding protein|nr:Crp/Fnr family transcriptional regulator [Crocinitomicaceae bacterium]MDP4724333.1 Crp/Fnr family transcriptional regulator [Crocinitomicaceae bacterium]MDP4739458.1 Crp/Fnr family transcriptional regulator [Crocinitomicaceae bacterium]MDP4799727.1 Crp/Fnr family transcriptional regulator [Crocinitomicaceae bacterium]MDP4805740.1 Crp/Fnr family transcriptional regulator [Crocinitomicaceae bacterium]